VKAAGPRRRVARGDIIFTKLNPLSWHMRMNEKVAIKIISLHFVGFFGQLFFSLFYTVFFYWKRATFYFSKFGNSVV
jgi:hypothetical protein